MGLYYRVYALVAEYRNSSTRDDTNYKEFNRKLIKLVIDHIMDNA